MSFKTLNIGATAMMAQQMALNTVGHNISNANTPGYCRQRVATQPNLPDQKTFGVLGSGAQVQSVTRVADEFLEKQVREAGTLKSYLETYNANYQNLEAIFNEMSGNDLSNDFDQFWNSISDVNNNVEDVSTRRAFVEKAKVLADTFQGLDTKMQDMRARMNENVVVTVGKVNSILEEVARLNTSIVKSELGGLGNVVANDSRDQRTERLKELGEILDVTVVEEKNGAAVVSLAGRLLVFENQFFGLETEQISSSDMLIDNVVFSNDKEEVVPGKGQLGAFMNLRDVTVLGFIEEVDRLAATFSWEFNRVHSQGQGLEGYSSLQSSTTVIDPTQKLNALTYQFTPLSDTYTVENGNAEILVRNEVTGEVTTKNIEIDLDNTGERDTVLHFDNNIDNLNSLSNLRLGGLTFGVDTDALGALHWSVTDTGIPGPGRYTVEAFNAATRLPAERVAFGAIANVSGEVTLTEANGSGVHGTVDLSFTANDATIERYDGFGNSFVQKLQTALDDAVPNTFQVSVDTNNRVTIDSLSSSYTFGFGRDTSGVFAALGLNTFFGGHDAGTLAVKDIVVDNPEFIAGSSTFVPGDNTNAVALLQVRDTGIYNSNTATIDDYYQGVVGRLGIEYSQSQSLLATQGDIYLRASNQREELSGVNLDEELTKMIQYQRSFQSAAKFISTADTIYETLINM